MLHCLTCDKVIIIVGNVDLSAACDFIVCVQMCLRVCLHMHFASIHICACKHIKQSVMLWEQKILVMKINEPQS